MSNSQIWIAHSERAHWVVIAMNLRRTSPLKEPEILEKWLILDLEQEMYKMCKMGCCVKPNNKAVM